MARLAFLALAATYTLIDVAVLALPGPTPVALVARAAVTTFPTAAGSISLTSPITVLPGEVFDGKMWRYDRGPGACLEQTEGDDPDAVFLVSAGATLKNVIIGPDQAEGVHCLGPCVIENVWWEDVCEDALTIKGDVPGDISYVRGGGARYAADKTLQHNGCGHLDVQDFFVYGTGKVYRSCGNCSTMCRRTSSFNNIVAVGVRDMFAGVNKSYKDVATFGNILTDAEDLCNGSPVFDGVYCVLNGTITSTHLSSTSKPPSTSKASSTKKTTSSTKKTTSSTKKTTSSTTALAVRTVA